MQSRAPLFLLGGINLTYNLIGKKTARTGAYGAFEVALKLSPMLFIFGSTIKKTTIGEAVAEDVAPVAERRATLSQ